MQRRQGYNLTRPRLVFRMEFNGQSRLPNCFAQNPQTNPMVFMSHNTGHGSDAFVILSNITAQNGGQISIDSNPRDALVHSSFDIYSVDHFLADITTLIEGANLAFNTEFMN